MDNPDFEQGLSDTCRRILNLLDLPLAFNYFDGMVEISEESAPFNLRIEFTRDEGYSIKSISNEFGIDDSESRVIIAKANYRYQTHMADLVNERHQQTKGKLVKCLNQIVFETQKGKENEVHET